MRSKKVLIVFICSLLVLVINQVSGYNFAYIGGTNVQAKVIKVYDGDTMTLLYKNQKLRIRLYGIDAPETKQSFGKQSTENLLKLCPIGSQAQLEIKERDKYKRIVGIVFCGGMDVNANQVENGFAWAYKEYSLAYLHLEIKARLHSRGLWSETNPMKPSDFRKRQY